MLTKAFQKEFKEFNLNKFAVNLDWSNAATLALLSKLSYSNQPADVKKDLLQYSFNVEKVRIAKGRHGASLTMISMNGALIFAFRGSEKEKDDWLTNAQINQSSFFKDGFGENSGFGEKVHSGFLKQYASLIPAIKTFLKEYKNSKPPIWVTGHSLGGALATLFTADLLMRDLGERRAVGKTFQGLYTFGQPLTGDVDFVESLNEMISMKSYRFVNNEDLITKIPPTFLNYDRHDTLVFFDESGNWDPNKKDRFFRAIGRMIKEQYEKLADKVEEQLVEAKRYVEKKTGVDDHGIDYYIRHSHLNRLKNENTEI